MPTGKRRHVLPETDELDAAAYAQHFDDNPHYPHESTEEHDTRGACSRTRQAAVEATRGSLTGAYPANYLDQLRDEW